MKLTDAALAYAKAGWPVFPLRAGGKVPQISRAAGGRGFKDATTDPEAVLAWWTRWPLSNIGMPTGELFDVLDIDVKSGGNGWGSFERLRRSGLLGGCVGVASTRNRGGHYYFPVSGEGCHALPHLDVKASGGYVVLPPSLIAADVPGGSGRYEWVNEPGTGVGAPLDWPRVKSLLRPQSVVSSVRPALGDRNGCDSGLVRVMLAAGEGSRNNVLFWALCRALQEDLDLVRILNAAEAVGLDPQEIAGVHRSATRQVSGESL